MNLSWYSATALAHERALAVEQFTRIPSNLSRVLGWNRQSVVMIQRSSLRISALSVGTPVELEYEL